MQDIPENSEIIVLSESVINESFSDCGSECNSDCDCNCVDGDCCSDT